MERYGKQLILAGLAIAAIPLMQGEIGEYFERFRRRRDRAVAAFTAKQRYKDGCIFVISAATEEPAVLAKGTPVFNRSTAAVLPEGTIVCDQFGTTGILRRRRIAYDWRSPAGYQYRAGDKLPIVSDIAWTGKPPAIAPESLRNGIGYIGRVSSKNE